jgi:hypothetical protein
MEAITEFSVGFNEEFTDEVLFALKKKIEYSLFIQKLTLKKGAQFTSAGVKSLFQSPLS